jgi:hypothetical protein
MFAINRRTMIPVFAAIFSCHSSFVIPHSSSLQAQEKPPATASAPWPPQIHPWGDFQPGAWKCVRVTTENFNDQGLLVSTNLCDSKTILVGRDDQSVTLKIQVGTEAGGKRLDGQTRTVRQGLHGEMLGPALRAKEPVAGQVDVEDRKIPCQIREVESIGPTAKTAVTLDYSPDVTPYLLKRRSVTTDLTSKQVLSDVSTTVLALDMPFKFQGALLSAAYVKTIQKTPQGTTITLAVVCPKIPGGIVSHASKELDADGRLIRRSTLELLDYGAEPEPDPPPYFNHRRSGRHRG